MAARRRWREERISVSGLSWFLSSCACEEDDERERLDVPGSGRRRFFSDIVLLFCPKLAQHLRLFCYLFLFIFLFYIKNEFF